MEYFLKSGWKIEIDEEDLTMLKQYNWGQNNGYIFRTENNRRIYLHRELTNAPQNMVVDHINGNPSDNRKNNLRVCTHKENMHNKRKIKGETLSKHKGVKPSHGKYESSIGRGNNYTYLGTYETEIEAAIAYNEKAKELYGKFARLNEIPEEYKNTIPKPVSFTSKYRGVTYYKRRKMWQVSIQHNKKQYHIGYFENEHEAAEAYNKKAIELLGDKAKLNNIINT